MIDQAYNIMLWISIAFLAVFIVFVLIRAILGPRYTDRVISVNLIGSKTIIIISLLSIVLEENGLVDIAMVYALISFVAVVVLSKCYIKPHHPNPARIGQEMHEEVKKNA